MRDGSDTKAKIEAAAMRLFVEKGVAETSIRDIAREAGVAEGALYRHHAGKEELVWSLFRDRYTGFAATLDGLQRDAPDLRGKLAAMVGAFCRFYDADPTLFRFLLLVQHGQLRKLNADDPTPIFVVRAAIVDGLARGEIPPSDPDLLTAAVVGILLQTATFKIYGRIAPSLGTLADELSASCWAVVARTERT